MCRRHCRLRKSVATSNSAPNYWQVIEREPASRVEGRTLALSVGEAPEIVVNTPLRAANLLRGVFARRIGARRRVTGR